MNNFDDIYANNVSSQKILSTHYNSFYFDVLNGLSKKNKKIPYKYLYDKNGVRLFNEICRQKEYYQTRTELHILKNNVKDILSKTKKKESLLYLGGCTVLKAEPFLKINKQIKYYYPSDISKKILIENSRKVAKKYKDIIVKPLYFDFSENLIFPQEVKKRRNILFFPGSTIGNFSKKKAKYFLKSLTEIFNKETDLLIGVDLKKNKKIIEKAYNDKNKITKKFILNILLRINRELNGDININNFCHIANYNENKGCIEVFVKSLRNQLIKINGKKIFVKEKEKIHVEDSHKYSEQQFKNIAVAAGWKNVKNWKDSNRKFSVFLLRN